MTPHDALSSLAHDLERYYSKQDIRTIYATIFRNLLTMIYGSGVELPSRFDIFDGLIDEIENGYHVKIITEQVDSLDEMLEDTAGFSAIDFFLDSVMEFHSALFGKARFGSPTLQSQAFSMSFYSASSAVNVLIDHHYNDDDGKVIVMQWIRETGLLR